MVKFAVCPAPPPPVIIAPVPGETVYDPRPFFVGSAEPGNAITVCVDGVCRITTADANGEWSVQAPQELNVGAHTASVVQQNDCGKTGTGATVTFSIAIPIDELEITALVRGQTFRTVDATFVIGQMSGPWTIYYLLLDPSLPAPTEDEVIGYDDPITLTDGRAARGVFSQPQQSGVTVERVLPGREAQSILPGETGVMDGQRYILYMVGVVVPGRTTGLAYSPETAIGMPFDSGNGTAAQPFMIRELTTADFVDYPDLVAGHPANRAGVNETARQLDNIEGMQVLYDQNPQNGIADSLALVYTLETDFDLAGYAAAYGGNGWRPIGDNDATHYAQELMAHRFTGTLSGTSHTVANLSMTPVGQADARWVQFTGFIGYAVGATVLDLTISQANIAPIPVLPAAAGFAMRAAAMCAYANNCTLEELSVLSATLTMDFGANAAPFIEAGGVAGELIGGTLRSIRVQDLSLSDRSGVITYFGGLAGYAHNDAAPQTVQSITLTDITCTQFSGTSLYGGGMLGYCNAVNSLAVESVTATNVRLQVPRAFSGGVIGYLRATTATVLRALSITAPVVESQVGGYYTGGVVGYAQALQRFALTDITVTGAEIRAAYAAAGMIGWMDVLNGADVEASDFTVDGAVQVNTSYGGGAFGEIARSRTSSLYIHGGEVLSGSSITGASNTGGLIGDLFHTGANSFVYIQNCRSAASVSGTTTNIGGLIGFCNMTALSGCAVTGRVFGGTSLTGGFIGSGGPVFITGCTTTADTSGASFIGGFIGSVSTGDVLPSVSPPFAAAVNRIELCSVRSTSVTATGSNAGGFSGRSLGMNYDQCFTLASVSAQVGNSVGGFIGLLTPLSTGNSGLVQNCYAVGNVAGTGQQYGGMIGSSHFPIESSYSASPAVSGNNQVGGIVGACLATAASVRACLALGGTVTAQAAQAGRIVAANTVSAPLQNNYAINTLVLIKNGSPATPVVNPAGLDGGTVTLAGLSALIVSIGWNTTTIWDVSTIPTLGRLTLRNNPE